MICLAVFRATKPSGRAMDQIRSIFGFAVLLVLVTLSSPSLGGDGITGTGDIELGQVRRFASEGAAHAGCAPDAVVWADSKTGFYYPKFFSDYGKTRHGAYTCYRDAKKADYWSLTPASDGGHKGREFPLFFCYTCS
jgi:hypothetical protein